MIYKNQFLNKFRVYAENVGFAYCERYDPQQFLERRLEYSNLLLNNYFGRLKIYAEIRKFKNLCSKNADIQSLKIYIMEGKLNCIIALLATFKPPNLNDLNIFVQCFKYNIEKRGYKWDADIPATPENIWWFSVDVVTGTRGKTKKFCNPLNTAQCGFKRSDILSNFYFLNTFGVLAKLLSSTSVDGACHSSKIFHSFCIKMFPISNGHYIICLLSKT